MLRACQLIKQFEKFGQQSKGVVFKRGMENMLGKSRWPALFGALEASKGLSQGV